TRRDCSYWWVTGGRAFPPGTDDHASSGHSSAAGHEMHHEQDDPDEEQHPRDLRGDGGDNEQTQRPRHQAEHQEEQRVIEHVSGPPDYSKRKRCATGTATNVAARLPGWWTARDRSTTAPLSRRVRMTFQGGALILSPTRRALVPVLEGWP